MKVTALTLVASTEVEGLVVHTQGTLAVPGQLSARTGVLMPPRSSGALLIRDLPSGGERRVFLPSHVRAAEFGVSDVEANYSLVHFIAHL